MLSTAGFFVRIGGFGGGFTPPIALELGAAATVAGGGAVAPALALALGASGNTTTEGTRSTGAAGLAAGAAELVTKLARSAVSGPA